MTLAGAITKTPDTNPSSPLMRILYNPFKGVLTMAADMVARASASLEGTLQLLEGVGVPTLASARAPWRVQVLRVQNGIS